MSELDVFAPSAEAATARGPKSSDTFQSTGTFSPPPSPFAALTAWDNRAAALTPSASGISWKAFELAPSGVAQELGSGSLAMATGLSLAVAALENQLIVASALPQQISVRRQPGAKTLPFTGAEKSVVLSGELGSFDGTHMAMAAARNRVAVVWLTQHALAAGQPVGGWALLECNNP